MDILKNEFSSMKPLSYYLDDASVFGCIMVVIHPWLGFGARTLGSLGGCVCSRSCVLFCTCSPFALPRFPRAVHGAFLARSLASSGSFVSCEIAGWIRHGSSTRRIVGHHFPAANAQKLCVCRLHSHRRPCWWTGMLSLSLGNPIFPSYSNESDL
jgi:hypothetical protein